MAQDWIEKDYYQTLGVSKDADAAAIKKAYRKLARKHHPDTNSGDAKAEAKFKDIGEAYAVLSDAEQRKQYDSIRTFAGGGARFQPGAGPGGTGGFEDLFGSMFGGGSPGGFSSPAFGTAGGFSSPSSFSGSGTRMSDADLDALFRDAGIDLGSGFRRASNYAARDRGADLAATTELPFRTAVEGATVELTVDGRNVTTRIPAGVNDGQKLRLRGKGRPGFGGGDAGDLVITVRVGKHPVFKMDGRNLRVTVPITFPEATLGGEIEVPTLSGDPVTVRVPAGTPSGRTLRVKGKGVASAKGTGDLLVKVEIAVPKNLTAAQKQALAQFTAAGGADVRADVMAGARR